MNYPNGLIILPAKTHAWVTGSGKATAKLGADAGEINPSGDWTDNDVEKELQKKNGLETQGCTGFAIAKILIALAKKKGYKHIPQNCSERYIGIGAENTPEGNDPWKVIETIAMKIGLIHEDILPFSENIHTWDEFYSPKKDSQDYKNFTRIGEQILRKTDIEPEWVLPPFNTYSPKEKAEILKKTLKRMPIAVSVKAWEETNDIYTKKVGERDNHFVQLLRYDKQGYPIVSDQYIPFRKRLAKDYDFNIALGVFMRENPTGVLPKDKPLYLKLLKKLLSLLQEAAKRLGVWNG